MLAGFASFFGAGPSTPETARERLCKLSNEKLFQIFRHGNVERKAFVDQVMALLGMPGEDLELQLFDLFDEASATSTSLSYAQLRHTLDTERSSSPASPISPSRRSATGDIFSSSSEAGEPDLVDRQAFRLAMLRIGLKAAPAEIDALFDMVDVEGAGAVKRADLLQLLRDTRVSGGGNPRMRMVPPAVSQPPNRRIPSPRPAPFARPPPLVGLPGATEDFRREVEEEAARALDATRAAGSARAAAAARVAAVRAASPRPSSPRPASPRGQRSPRPASPRPASPRPASPRAAAHRAAASPARSASAPRLPRWEPNSAPRTANSSAGGSVASHPRPVLSGAEEKAKRRLKDALGARLTEMVDLFTRWDVDSNGLVDKGEFREAVAALGYGAQPEAVVDSVFDDYDGDQSGAISYREYVRVALRDALAHSTSRVMDLFHKWDADQSGTVDRQEFRRGIVELGFDAPTAEVDLLFAEADRDGSGKVEFKELNAVLRQGAPAVRAKPLPHSRNAERVARHVKGGLGVEPDRHHATHRKAAHSSAVDRPMPLGPRGPGVWLPLDEAVLRSDEGASATEGGRSDNGLTLFTRGTATPVRARAATPPPRTPLSAAHGAPSPPVHPSMTNFDDGSLLPRQALSPPPRPSSTPQSRRQHSAAQEKLAQSLVAFVPGPGAYDSADVDNLGRSARAIKHAPSPWALSTAARLPDATTSEWHMGGAPGEYTPVIATKPMVSERASATASPSMHSRRGYMWHSATPHVRLDHLPFNQGVKEGSEATPGPGAYNPTEHDPRCATSGNGRGVASTSFRSTTPQHNPAFPATAPPPGAYDVDAGWAQTSSKVGSFSRLTFASKTDRFAQQTSSTGTSVGPGSYSPDVGEIKAKARGVGGKQGAQSYPFSSTDRRLGKGRRMLQNENDVYEADLIFAELQAQAEGNQ